MKHSPLASALLLLLCFSVHAQTASPDNGEVKHGVYINLFFGLGFNYPKGWVVHEDAINDRIEKRAKEEAAKSGTSSELKNTYPLFTASRYPRGTPGVTLNPTVGVIAENIFPVPKNFTGKDYLLGLRQLQEKRGARPLLNEPVEFPVDGWLFFETTIVPRSTVSPCERLFSSLF